jgi:putative phosphoribosyl transferase
MSTLFRDRYQAGKALAMALHRLRDHPNAVILALPRGGVPVGAELSDALRIPLDTFIVRKLGVPAHEELAMGALASGGVRILDHDLIQSLGISEAAVAAACERERAEIARREKQYRVVPLQPVHGKTVILTDDGLATGASMLAAVQAVRKLQPERILVAVPLAARETCSFFQSLQIETVCLHTPEPFRAVGVWYEDFSQTTDEEVRSLLQTQGARHD